jgi:hypothetical protein
VVRRTRRKYVLLILTLKFYIIYILIYSNIPSLLTDFKISNFVTFSYSGSMKDNKDNREVFLFHTKNVESKNVNVEL